MDGADNDLSDKELCQTTSFKMLDLRDLLKTCTPFHIQSTRTKPKTGFQPASQIEHGNRVPQICAPGAGRQSEEKEDHQAQNDNKTQVDEQTSTAVR